MLSVCINSKALLQEFRSDTSVMTNMDYDEDEILAELFNIYSKNGPYAYDTITRYSESFCNHGVFAHTQSQVSPDGTILMIAVRKLSVKLTTQLKTMKLCNDSNRLTHYYADRRGDLIILAPILPTE